MFTNNDASLLATLTQLANLSPPDSRDAFTGFLAMVVTILAIAATASYQPSGLISGLTGVFVLAGFSFIGWVSYDVVFVATVGLIGVAGINRGL